MEETSAKWMRLNMQPHGSWFVFVGECRDAGGLQTAITTGEDP